MREYWYIFLAVILCAAFSKQIDDLLAKATKDNKKRAVLYCIVGGAALAIIGYLIYGAVQPFMQGHNAIILAIAPASLFVFGIIAGICFAKARKKSRKTIKKQHHKTPSLHICDKMPPAGFLPRAALP